MEARSEPKSRNSVRQAPPILEWLSFLKERVAIGVVYAADPQSPGVVAARTTHPRVWKSYRRAAEQIAEGLRANGFRLVELVSEGAELQAAIHSLRFQLFWLASAGIQGQASIAHAAALLESSGFPYVGHTPLQSALLDDRVLLRQWLNGIGLPTAPFVVRSATGRASISNHDPDFVREFGLAFKGPFLVRPALGPGAAYVRASADFSALNAVVADAANASGDRVVIEAFLEGQEFSVWASRGVRVADGQPISRQESMAFGFAERFFDLRDQKRPEGSNLDVELHRPLSETEGHFRESLAYLARTVLSALGLYLPVRVDLRLGSSGGFTILEIAPKPDLALPAGNASSLFSIALEDQGCTFEDFIVKILADWLDCQLRFSPSALALLQPLFDRYCVRSEQRAAVHQ